MEVRDLLSRYGFPGDDTRSTLPGKNPSPRRKANDGIYWWVGGKRYTFCCTPCIEEFVLKAKKNDDAAKMTPEEYVKK